jgi:hypothetical protein
VVASNRAGETVEDSATFQVRALHKPFIAADDIVTVDGAQYAGSGSSFVIEGVSIDGRRYDLTLEWSTATQGFEIIGISAL